MSHPASTVSSAPRSSLEPDTTAAAGVGVQADLMLCDREPIHIPASIQPHGFLLVLSEPELTVLQWSENAAERLGWDSSIEGLTADALLPPELALMLHARMTDPSLIHAPLHLGVTRLGAAGRTRLYQMLAHRINGVMIVEAEDSTPSQDGSFRGLYGIVRAFLAKLEGLGTVEALTRVAAAEVRWICGYDRTMIYRFEPDWSGTVIAEDGNGNLPSYLDLRFPASDIPAQARALYEASRVRMIPNADYRPVPVVPACDPQSGKPLDLSYAALRSVSPVHVEYMKNMGTAASMSVSILREGRLWGLISCHNAAARQVSFEARTACDLIGQALAVQIGAKEHLAEYEHRIWLKSTQTRLLEAMASRDHFVAGIADRTDDLLRFASADGAAILYENRCVLLGKTPTEEQVRSIADWLATGADEEVFAAHDLPLRWCEAEAFRDQAAGLMAIAISKLHRSYVLWFRPELIQTVKWGGDPTKPVTDEPGGPRIHPRKSFEAWKETVRDRSLPFRASEVAAATELRNTIVGIVLRRAEEMAQMAAELERSNKELEAFSYSVSHDLRAPFRHILGYAELLNEIMPEDCDDEAKRYLETIIESAHHAGSLVDHLLMFSRMGRSQLTPTSIDMTRLVQEVAAELRVGEPPTRQIKIQVDVLPRAWGDLMMVRLVAQNLLSNALKYSRDRQPAEVHIWGEVDGAEAVYHVRDNGVGFDMAYENKLFGVFQRLHRVEDFEGSGIGLANVRRLVSRHGGRTWADGKVDHGATFSFSLPLDRNRLRGFSPC